MSHLETEQIVRYVAGESDEDEAFAVQTHIGECADCLARLRGVQLLRQDFDGVWAQWTAASHGARVRQKAAAGLVTLGDPAAILGDTNPQDRVPTRTVLVQFLDQGRTWLRTVITALTPARLAWVGVGVVALCGLTYVALRPPAVRLADAGGTVRVLADGRLRLPEGVDLANEWQQRLAPLLAGAAVSVDPNLAARLQGLRADLVRLGPSERPAPLPLGPVGVVIRPGPVTFRWQGVEGATNYTLLVSDGARALVERDTRAATNLVLSPAELALAPGGEYAWQVAAMAGDELLTCSPVRFAVLGAASARELETIEAGAGRSALVMTGVFLQYGLLDDAAVRLDDLRRLNPDSPVVARLDRLLAAAQGEAGP